ncbi:MAG: hypothetical protein GY762_23670, partial [Proteobacteria bacterium]|nr:hypothetical protein [Pseudomonadota bacterium]
MMFNLHSKFDYPTALRWWLVLVLICCAATSIHAQGTTETKSVGENTLTGRQQSTSGEFTIRPIRTDSPRNTLKSFLRLRDELEQTLQSYRLNKSRELAEQMEVILDQLLVLLDLSSVARASRREIGIDTTAFLLDILGRVELPDLDKVPGEEAFEDDVSPAKWRIPGTPIRIVRADEGPREGEFLFSERTVKAAPRFYRGIEDLPLQTSLPIISWNRALPQITGPMIPAAVLRLVPQSVRDFWLDTPKWKVITVVLVSVLATLLLFVFHRAINRRETDNRVGFLLRRILTPIAILVVVWSLKNFIAYQINVSGAFSSVVD